MNTEKVYSHIYIGTGPISAIDAVYKQKKRGQNVLMIDEKSQIGGAWVAIEVGTYGRLEVGCHIWSYNQKAYEFLGRFFNLDLVNLDPQPFFAKGERVITYDYKHFVSTLKRIVKEGTRLRLRPLSKFLIKHPAARLSVVPKKYLYPRGGAREFQEAIIQLLLKRKINVALEQKVVSIQKKEGIWELTTDKGEKFFAKKVNLTSTSGVQRIETSKTKLAITHKNINYAHFHIVIDQKLAIPLSYVRVIDDEFIHRLSDVTYQLKENKNLTQTVLLVGVFYDKKPAKWSDDQMMEHIMDYLVKRKWVDPTVNVLYSQLNHFETSYIPRLQIKAIQQLDDSIKLIHTTDLIYGVHARLNEWQS